jgi:hypothetical protein
MEGKICKICDTEKPLLDFYSHKTTKDGKRPECKICFKLKAKNNYYNNQEKNISYSNTYRKLNQEKVKEIKKKYRINNSDKVKNTIKVWHQKNPNKEREYGAKRREKYPYIEAWRSTLKNTLKRLGQTKEGHTIDLLGYSAIELKEYITNLFTTDMTWDNYGEWHIDHIKPVSSFDSDTPVNIVNSLSNLRPMWATTREINGINYLGNLNKSSKII